MKYLFSLLLVLSFIASHSPVSADYFQDEIVGTDPETALLEEITLNTQSFRDINETKRYNSTIYLVSTIKSEATKRFAAGSIPLYRRYDIITNLDSFVYTMNQYFLYQKKYEQTKKTVFRDSARSYLQDSRGAYDRLRMSLKKSGN